MAFPGNSSKWKIQIGLIAATIGLLAFAASASAEVAEMTETAAMSAVETVEAPAPPVEPEPIQTAPVVEAAVAEEVRPAPAPKPVAVEAPSVVQTVQKLAQSVDRASADLVTPVAEAAKGLAQKSLDAIGSASPPPERSLGSPPPRQSDSSSHRPVIGASPFQPPLAVVGIEGIAVGSGASGHPDGRAEARLPAAVATPSRATIGGPVDRSEAPAPLDVPPPAPESPGTIAPGAGGSLFVPLVALLALLALAAPAILRRPWGVPDFRPPSPFACALERPG